MMADYPDFTVIARLKGEYAGAEKSVVLDSEGALQALLYGTYGGANKKIVVDTDGNVRMNLYAQDLDEMVNRFKYGAPTYSKGLGTMGIQGYNTLWDISGKGYIYYLDVELHPTVSHKTDVLRVTIDGEEFTFITFEYLEIYQYRSSDDLFLNIRRYDEVEFRYRMNGLRGFTFESSLKIEYFRAIADNPLIARTLVYTLI